MSDKEGGAPDGTAARVALWRALHVAIDPPPHVLEDEIGLRLLAPDKDWRRRGDMAPEFAKPFRASIVARARFIEDLLVKRAEHGLAQYVILGAGLDSFAQRRAEIAAHLRVFEIDRPGPQAWKRQRLIELGFGIPDWLRFVPVDFEAGASWRDRLVAAGFDENEPALVASAGVSMYLTREANAVTLGQVAAFAAGSTLVMSFMTPPELVDPGMRSAFQVAATGARTSGTPFVSFFTPSEIVALAREAGFKEARHVSSAELGRRYFARRADGLRPPDHAEELLVATT